MTININDVYFGGRYIYDDPENLKILKDYSYENVINKFHIHPFYDEGTPFNTPFKIAFQFSLAKYLTKNYELSLDFISYDGYYNKLEQEKSNKLFNLLKTTDEKLRITKLDVCSNDIFDEWILNNEDFKLKKVAEIDYNGSDWNIKIFNCFINNAYSNDWQRPYVFDDIMEMGTKLTKLTPEPIRNFY